MDITNMTSEKLEEFTECKTKLLQRKKLLDKNKIELSKVIDAMEDIYRCVKENARSFYIDGEFTSIYEQYFIKSLLSCEGKLRDIKLIDFTPEFDYQKKVHFTNGMSETEVLKYIVYTERKRLVEEKDSQDLNAIDVTSECLDSTYNIEKHCDNLDIKCERIRINPCFYNNKDIKVSGFHYFAIITLHDKKYLVDCTYPQFFNYDANMANRLGIPLLKGCYVGYYMIVDEKRKTFARQLLEDGYIEWNAENIKYYLDGFAISYRNGLYYENLGRIEYSTNYKIEDYLKFIYTEDNQYNYEKRDFLDYQKYPLKDTSINFNKVYKK